MTVTFKLSLVPQSQKSSSFANVSWDRILSPLLFNIYTSDQPTSQNTNVVNYTNNKAIISIDKNPLTTSANLLTHCNLMSMWHIKPNPNKSVPATFILSLHLPWINLKLG